MPSQAPPPSSPAGVPSSGNAKYVVLAVALLGLMGAAIVLLRPKPPPPVVVVDAAAPPPSAVSGRDLDEEIPLPPVLPEAGAEPVKKAATLQVQNQCDAKKCVGSSGSDLEGALQQRVRQAHRCYDNALSQDPTLRGKMTIAVRVGSNGQVCSAGIANNEMGSAQVASCVAGFFRGVNLPSPKGGCIDVNIPINFVPRQ